MYAGCYLKQVKMVGGFADLCLRSGESEGGCQEGHGHQLRKHVFLKKKFVRGPKQLFRPEFC